MKYTTNEEKTDDAVAAAAATQVAGGQESAFLVCDEAEIRAKVKEIVEDAMAGLAAPVFDVFCNCHPLVLATLSELGFTFRAGSKAELTLAAAAGVRPERVLFDGRGAMVASHLRTAAHQEVRAVAFRSGADLKKIKKEFPRARLLLTLNANQTRCGGAPSAFDSASDLLSTCAQLDLTVVGVAFQGGDDGKDEADYRQQLALAKLLLSVGKMQFGMDGMEEVHLSAVAGVERAQELSVLLACSNTTGLSVSFGLSAPVVSSAFVLCAKVIGRRDAPDGTKTLIVNEGVFGHFGRLLHRDCKAPTPRPLSPVPGAAAVCDLYGPTGDDADVIGLGVAVECGDALDAGHWVLFPEMGDDVLTPANPERMAVVRASERAGMWYFLGAPAANSKESSDPESVFACNELQSCGLLEQDFAVTVTDSQELDMFTRID